MKHLTAFFSILFSVAAAAQTAIAPTAAEGHALAERRAATLTRGINLSGWFGGWGDYSPEHTSTFVTQADFTAMRAMGIGYVRFPFDPVLLTRGGLLSPNKDEMWKRLDAALDMTLASGLAVDFVVFPRDDYKQQLATQNGVDQYVLLWQLLAAHLASRNPDRVFFELMNECEVQDPYRWIGIESQVVHAIRRSAPRHTILASGAHYDSIPDLLETQPLPDANIIYTFHYYEPYPFTHQGATWGSFDWNFFKNVPYPATSETIAPLLPAIPFDNARYQLYLYGQGNWNAKGIADRLAFVAAWGREHGVPVICNEFGADRETAPPDSRTRFLHDVRDGLEANGIGWAMWDWGGNFGLVTHAGGAITPDLANVKALGLKSP